MSNLSNNKEISLAILAKRIGCSTSNVKVEFLKDLAKDQPSIIAAQKLLIEFRQKKKTESIQLKIDPNDTPASFIETWILEFIESITPQPDDDKTHQEKVNYFKDMLQKDPDLQKRLLDHLINLEESEG
jgi:hypothetical protein